MDPVLLERLDDPSSTSPAACWGRLLGQLLSQLRGGTAARNQLRLYAGPPLNQSSHRFPAPPGVGRSLTRVTAALHAALCLIFHSETLHTSAKASADGRPWLSGLFQLPPVVIGGKFAMKQPRSRY